MLLNNHATISVRMISVLVAGSGCLPAVNAPTAISSAAITMPVITSRNVRLASFRRAVLDLKWIIDRYRSANTRSGKPARKIERCDDPQPPISEPNACWHNCGEQQGDEEDETPGGDHVADASSIRHDKRT